jgi:hypothetical protein
MNTHLIHTAVPSFAPTSAPTTWQEEATAELLADIEEEMEAEEEVEEVATTVSAVVAAAVATSVATAVTTSIVTSVAASTAGATAAAAGGAAVGGGVGASAGAGVGGSGGASVVLIFSLQKLATVSRMGSMNSKLPVVSTLGQEFEWTNAMVATPWTSDSSSSSATNGTVTNSRRRLRRFDGRWELNSEGKWRRGLQDEGQGPEGANRGDGYLKGSIGRGVQAMGKLLSIGWRRLNRRLDIESRTEIVASTVETAGSRRRLAKVKRPIIKKKTGFLDLNTTDGDNSTDIEVCSVNDLKAVGGFDEVYANETYGNETNGDGDGNSDMVDGDVDEALTKLESLDVAGQANALVEDTLNDKFQGNLFYGVMILFMVTALHLGLHYLIVLPHKQMLQEHKATAHNEETKRRSKMAQRAGHLAHSLHDKSAKHLQMIEHRAHSAAHLTGPWRYKIGKWVTGFMDANVFPIPELSVVVILYQGTTQSSAALMVDENSDTTQALALVIYCGFPICFLCFVLYINVYCLVLQPKARWVPPPNAKDIQLLRKDPLRKRGLFFRRTTKQDETDGIEGIHKEGAEDLSDGKHNANPVQLADLNDILAATESSGSKSSSSSSSSGDGGDGKDSARALNTGYEQQITVHFEADGDSDGGQTAKKVSKEMEEKPDKQERKAKDKDTDRGEGKGKDKEDEEEEEEEEEEGHWEDVTEGSKFVDKYSMLFADFRGARNAALMKPIDIFRMLLAGTVISVLADSSTAQAMLVFGIQALQFVLEVVYRPEVDPHETILSILAMATELVPLGMCLWPADNLGCGKLSLELQLVVLGVAMLSILQRILGLMWGLLPQIWMLGQLIASSIFCAKKKAKEVSMQRKKMHSAQAQNKADHLDYNSGYCSIVVELDGVDNKKWSRLAAAQPLTWEELPDHLSGMEQEAPTEQVTDEESIESIVRGAFDLCSTSTPRIMHAEEEGPPSAASPVLHIDVADPM